MFWTKTRWCCLTVGQCKMKMWALTQSRDTHNNTNNPHLSHKCLVSKFCNDNVNRVNICVNCECIASLLSATLLA
jgi:hypothetical protein